MAKAKTSKKDDSFEDGEESLTINMNEVAAQSFETIPKGTYNVTIEEAEYQLSKSSNKPMWNLKLTITDGDYAGRKIFTILSFSEGALPGTKAAIQRFAPNLLSSSFNPKAIAEAGDLVGIEARVKTKIEQYNDQDQTRVAQWLAASSDAFAA